MDFNSRAVRDNLIVGVSRLLATLLVVLSSYTMYSQGDGCGTMDGTPDPDQIGSACSISINYAPLIPIESPIKTLRIAFHVMQDQSGQGNFQNNTPDLQYLQNVVDQANWRFGSTGPLINGTSPYIEDTRIRIILENIYFHQSDVYAVWPDNANMFETWVCNDLDNTGYSFDETFNVEHIFLKALDGGTESVGGTTFGTTATTGCAANFFTAGAQGWIGEGDWYLYYQIRGPGDTWKPSGNLVHELGHAMGLLHSTGSSCDPCLDNNLADGSCPPAGNGNNYMDRNYLGWNHSNPMPGFSQCQLGIMHYYLDGNVPSKNIYRAVVNDYCISSAQDPITVTAADRVWLDSKKLKGDLIIEPDASLTVKCRVHMPSGSKVIVKPGGRLILDEGVFTNLCGQFWSGIEVWGNNTQNQYGATVGGQYRDFANQGYVELRNGGTVEHARCAIAMKQGNTYGTFGGVVRSYGGVFRNNRRAVEFLSYQNTAQGSSAPTSNRSFFHNTLFTVDDDYRGGNDFSAHVTMWDVSGITFSGCDFSNAQTTINESAYLGLGIGAADSKFTVKASCNGPGPNPLPCPTAYERRSTFTGLDHGVHVQNSFSHRSFVVEDASFTDNVCGVYANGVVGFKVANSTFHVGGREVSLNHPDEEFWEDRHRAIFSTGSYSFIIDENDIHQSGTNLTEGIVVGYSRDHSDMVFGNKASGLESAYIGEGICASTSYPWSIGLQFLCNTNTDNDVNFWSRRVTQDIENYDQQTIRTNQGGMARAPDNSFDQLAGNLDFKNTNLSNNILYWWKEPETPFKPTFLSAGLGLADGVNGNLVYRPARNCDSRRVPPYPYPFPNLPTGLKSLMLQHKGDHANNWFLYKQLIDGGSTDEVLEELQESWPQGAWAMRDYLLARSPYLSVSVLKEALSKPDMPAAMKAEVCIANPDATGSQGFMDWLRDECPYPMSATLLQSIEASWDTKTFRTQLEATLAYHHGEMTQAANQLIQYHQSDSTDQLDSLRSVWHLIRTPAARYAEALTYLQEKRFTEASAVIGTIPLEHDPKEQDENERQHMLDLIAAFKGMHDAGRPYHKMTQGDIAAVEAIITGHHDRATNWARNILCWHHHRCKPPYTGGEMGDNSPKSRRVGNADGTPIQPPHLKLYPNPSTNWTTAEIDLQGAPKNAMLVVQDITGRVLQQLIVANENTQLIIDSRPLAPGSYRVELQNDGKLLHSEILIIRQ